MNVESERKKLTTKLSRFHSDSTKPSAKLKFLVTSRPYDDIESTFYCVIDDMPSISLQSEHESDIISKDINLVIDHDIPRICSGRRTPFEPEVQNFLREKLKNMPHRTDLWLHLIFDIVRES